MRRNNKLASVAALIIAAPLLLAGCADSDSSQGGSDSVIDKLNGSSQSDTSNSNDSTKTEEEEDENDTPEVSVESSGNLPQGWPSEAIVPKGEISYSGKVDDAFSVIMLAENSDIDAAIDAMKSKGWNETLNMGSSDGRIVSLENSDWTIGMIVGEDETSGKMSVIYTVTPL